MDAQNPQPDYTEAAGFVQRLAHGKRRLRSGGLVSVYRLRNGWLARRQQPESGWARQAYWNLYATQEDMDQHRALGGGEGRLTRAIANVLNHSLAHKVSP